MPKVTPQYSQAANHVLFHIREGGYEPGGFTEALLRAWDRADSWNSAALSRAFPDLGGAVELARNGDIEELKTVARGG